MIGPRQQAGRKVASGEWRVASKNKEEAAMAVQHYRELKVWQVAMDLAAKCYQVTKGFPREELFGMTSQIRRAAASVPANIAEGQGRHHTKEFLNHLSMARGSLMELETHLLLSNRVSLLAANCMNELLGLSDQVSRMLSGLRKALEGNL
jgi:four helix bundle protein